MLKVMERKTQKEAVAVQQESGRYTVRFQDGEVRDLAESTFRRLFTVLEENVTVEETQVTEEEDESLDDLLAGGTELILEEQQVEEEVEEEVQEEMEEETSPDVQEDKKEEKKPEKEKDPERSVEDLGLGIELLDWKMQDTRGGKTDKVISQVSICGKVMEITEYDGYITDVRVFQENPDAPENDPDEQWVEVYRSPKMSLKDTLDWFGLSQDDAKLARREITAIRRNVKEAYLEQQAEQEEVEEEEQSADLGVSES